MQKTVFKKIKRFLEPIKKSPLVYFRASIIYLNWWINWVIHILFLQKITFALETQNVIMFNKLLFFYIIYFLYFYIAQFFLRKYGWTEVMNQIIRNIQWDYIKKYVRLDNNWTEKYWTWKSISILVSWFDTWWRLVYDLFENGFSFLVSVVFTIYMLSKVDNIYILFFIVILVIMFFVVNYLNNICIKYRNLRNESKNLYTKQLVKILMSKNEVFQSNKVDNEISILDHYMIENIYYNKKMDTPIYWLFFIPSWVILIILIFIFYYLGNQFLEWQIALSNLIWVTWSVIVIQKSIELFTNFYKNITKDFVMVDALWNFFDSTPEIEWYDNWDKFICEKWSFEIKNLEYSYNQKNKVFNSFDLKIDWEKVLAIVWASWWWKTTLVKLLSWYIRQDFGDIIIDNQNIKDITLKSYYENIGYLTQDPSIFDWTVLENLNYSVKWKVEKDELDKIIRASKCEFIYELSNWLDTEIWERGVKLSWWQKQRLAIAKIMLKNPKIIFLDEPTSALDSFSEEQITKAMQNLFKWKTVIIIAHRLQTVKHADRIIYIENGTIIEDWTHSWLVKLNWKYKKMLDLQSGF